MKRVFLATLLLSLFSFSVHAQNTNVSATITDTGGQVWFNGNYTFNFVPSPRFNGTYRRGGVAFIPPILTGNLDAAGSFTNISVPDNNQITPSGSQWTVTVCGQTGFFCFTSQPITITGASQVITGSVIPSAIVVTCGPGVVAYADVEVRCGIGGHYYNLTSLSDRVCTAVTGNLCTTWIQVVGLGATRVVGGTDTDLQSAINNAGNGGTVIVPPGSSLNLISTITIAHALHLIIQTHLNSTADPIFAVTGTGGLVFQCGGDGPTGKAITDSAPTITQNTVGAKMMTIGDGVAAFRGGIVENCRFVAATNSSTSTFQLNANIGDFKFRHLFISGAGFDGTAGNYTRVSFDHVRIDSAQNQAWNFQCAIGCVADWNNTYANATGGSPAIGYDLGGAGGVTGSFTSCYADSNSQAFRIKGNIRITNCETEGNTGDGINIVGGGLITINGYRSFQDQLPVVMNATGATVIIDGIRTQNTGGANSITVLGSDSVMRVNSYEQLDKAPVATAPGKLIITFKPGLFGTLLACSAGLEGSEAVVTDSTTATYAATITGTGANHVHGYCNGTNWVVD